MSAMVVGLKARTCRMRLGSQLWLMKRATLPNFSASMFRPARVAKAVSTYVLGKTVYAHASKPTQIGSS